MIGGFYSQSYRSYHKLNQIRRMLDDMKNIFNQARVPKILAIWFHDLVYIPGSSENGVQSAWIAGRRYFIEKTLIQKRIFLTEEPRA